MPELRHLTGVQGILKNEGTLRSCDSLIEVPRLLPDSGQRLDSECGRVNRQASPSAPVQVRKGAQGRRQGRALQRTGVAPKEKGRGFSISWTRRPGRPALPLPPSPPLGLRACEQPWYSSYAVVLGQEPSLRSTSGARGGARDGRNLSLPRLCGREGHAGLITVPFSTSLVSAASQRTFPGPSRS